MKPILLDCDGVLSDMTASVLQLAREQAQIFDKDEADITDWSYAKSLGWPGADAAITRAVDEREFCFRMPPYLGAIPFLRRLENTYGPSNVIVCTSPWNEAWAAQRLAWLRMHGVPSSRVIIASAKHLIPGTLLDDGPKNLEGRKGAICFNRPWNKTVYLPLAKRVRTYAEAEQAIAEAM